MAYPYEPDPLWAKLRSEALTPEGLLKTLGVATVPIDVDSLLKLLGVRLIVAGRGDSTGTLWFSLSKRQADLNVDSDAWPNRRRFTTAFHLCHLLRHAEGTYHRPAGEPEDELDEEANDFAARLLIPERGLILELLRHPPPPDVPRLARLFRVADPTMDRRLLALQDQWAAAGVSEAERLLALDLPQDARALFGIARRAPTDAGKPAFYALLDRFHPDKFPPELRPQAEARSRAIISAFKELELSARQDPQPVGRGSTRSSRPGPPRPPAAEVVAVLTKALGFVLMGWSKGARARTADGAKTSATATEAAQFSLVGAVERAAGGDVICEAAALDALARVVKERRRHLQAWNDRRGRERSQVADAFEAALRSLQASADGPTDGRP